MDIGKEVSPRSEGWLDPRLAKVLGFLCALLFFS